MSIGELARSAGVPISTLRFYERRGLLRPASRSRAGYRRYVESDVVRVRFLRRAQELGFRLSELDALLQLSEGRDLARDEVERLGRSKLAEIETCIEDLRRVHGALESLLAAPCIDASQPCPVLAALGGQRDAPRTSAEVAP